jgi:ATP-dependent RNA helicase RhlE
LIKTKLEVENYPLPDDRSRADAEPRRDDRRGDRGERRDDRRPDRGFERRREEDDPRDRRSSFRPPQVSRDPFFEKPYEAPSSEQGATASWESTPKTAVARPGVSPNIKPKRKVAALFKAGQ